MCFGGGGDSVSNVKTPAYAPQDAYTAVETSVAPATGKTDPADDGMNETTLPNGTVKTGAVGLKM